MQGRKENTRIFAATDCGDCLPGLTNVQGRKKLAADNLLLASDDLSPALGGFIYAVCYSIFSCRAPGCGSFDGLQFRRHEGEFIIRSKALFRATAG
jgi:hypothetical protein